MFTEIPATKNSIANRKPIFGVGINDADYLVQPEINGNKVSCKFYNTWKRMIERCYSDSYHQRKPTYKDCTVSPEWVVFSNFKAWMITQDWKGKALDKDVIIPKNKIYSPSTCVFISKELNNLLNDRKSMRGLYPRGVYLLNNKFAAGCTVNGKSVYLGTFENPIKASDAYKKFKSDIIASIAIKQSDPRIKAGLLLHSDLILTE